MAFDLAALTSTPDIRCLPDLQTRLVGAWRYTHIARRSGCYRHTDLVRYLGNAKAIRPFHVLADEIGRAWPEPFVLNPPCQPLCSYDEMLMLDMTAAAAKDNRRAFDDFLADMVPERPREALWRAARRLMRPLVLSADRSDR